MKRAGWGSWALTRGPENADQDGVADQHRDAEGDAEHPPPAGRARRSEWNMPPYRRTAEPSSRLCARPPLRLAFLTHSRHIEARPYPPFL
ncbi:MAG TPA: hypothetical protein VFB61_09490 [Gemmatimonadales bacterium]|nr:hypothetical protein [Gemmatimonadales bacterium]